MKKKIEELRAKIKVFLERMDEIHQLTITEERKMSEEEKSEYDGSKVKISELNENIIGLALSCFFNWKCGRWPCEKC